MDVISQLPSLFSALNRLYVLEGPDSVSSLQIERWSGREALSEIYRWDVYALATDPGLDLDAMVGQRVTVTTTLANGSTAARSGLVAEAACIGYDGTLARYHLQLVPWLEALAYGRDQRTFVNRTIAEVLETVFADYRDTARWRFTADANQRIDHLGACEYRVQYRTHTNLDFVLHVLAEAGLGFCFVEDPDAPAGHVMLIFDDSAQLPEDETSARLGGLPLRLDGMAVGTGDVVLGMGQTVSLTADRVTLISSDYRRNQAVTATEILGNPAGLRELYDDVGPEAFKTLREAEDMARRQADAIVSQADRWVGTSTLHTARAGRALRVTGVPWQYVPGAGGAHDSFLVTCVTHVGINNLPRTIMEALAQTLGVPPSQEFDPGVLKEASVGGYCNRFECVPRQQVWRPTLEDGTGQRLNPVPTALGAQTAIVVGPQGESQAGAAGPVHTDAQGRLKLRYHWQADGDTGVFATRAMQRLASDGHGLQQTQRIGHEVLVQFMNGLIHRPIILGGLFNGRGEGGEPPTPGGEAGRQFDESVYAKAADHAPSAQGNQVGGYSPAWHGAGAGPQRHNHAGALSGFKSQGFDGQGHNQLVTDDSDGMGRLQMATTHAATQLNLGHLRHQADNYLGSFRGQGVELRSDAYGAVRAPRGMLISSYAPAPAQPAGDVAALKSLLAQQIVLARTFDKAADTHRTLPLAAQRGVQKVGQSSLDADAAPLDALSRSLATTVSVNGFEQAVADASGHAADKALPHTGDALLGIAAQGGQGLIAGQALQWAAGETLTIGSGGHSSVAVSQVLRIHSGQGIGWLAGANGTAAPSDAGLSVISGKDNLDLQAQHGSMALRAKDDLTVAATKSEVELAAGQALRLAVSGGASLLIEGGNVTFACPGNLTVHAADHQFAGPTDLDKARGAWGDHGLFNEYFWLRDAQTGGAVKNLPYRLVGEGGGTLAAHSGAGDGRTATYSTKAAAKPIRVEYTGNEDIDHGWS
ncbi:type VI secretion system Vgr family protein [Burkholderia pseudomultivorans]|uniref:Type IV secretion protein Rhs n=1 Tax=Burkholderia pseudomultivorans TaxID=1207504 RepID=A0A132F5A4_9BURK|nr:type VI secretion system Vgr family protein [Burkholderia pseudomultivorans]KWF68426.1 type IV secretion protein Rhs [Burkholderia pseudomultivorans]